MPSSDNFTSFLFLTMWKYNICLLYTSKAKDYVVSNEENTIIAVVAEN